MRNKQIWSDNAIYFLTDSTYLHFPYFKTDEQKKIVLNQIKRLKTELNIPISAYSIAVNHYHLKFYLEKGENMFRVKQLLRGGISYEYKKKYKTKYKELWQSRKILQILSEEMNWKVSGYIAGNLIKHKEVSTFEELKNNSFSSYAYMTKEYGEDLVRDMIYQVIDVDENAEGVVDFLGLKSGMEAKAS